MSNLTHLHGHSQFSFLDAMTRPNELFERVKSIDQTAVAVTDHGNSYAVAEMLKTSKKYGVKYIAGNEFYVGARGMEDRTARDSYHLTVLCDGSKQGWKNLCNLHHLSFAKGFFYSPRIDLDVLAEHSEGLIALSGCMGGAALKAYLNDNEDEALQRLERLKEIFGSDRFFIELQNHGLENDKVALPWLRSQAKRLKLKSVATNDYHYCNRKDWEAHDVLIAIGKNQCVFDPNRSIAYEPEQFFIKDYDEMAEMGFSKAELEQSQKIADMCEELDLDTKTFHIPKISDDSNRELRQKAKAGAEKRYGKDDNPEVRSRLKYELDAITKAGFSDYILIVANIYDFMRQEKISFGPGRGSVGGSLVAYALGITEVDPLHYELPFERFINPERISMPDIDMDISAIHRDRVIQYVRDKYGSDKTAQILTAQSIGARAAIRDVGRAFRLPLDKVDTLAKAVPLEGSLTKDRESRGYLESALSQKVIKNAYDSDPVVQKVIDAGMRLEGITKAASKHAAGVVISDVPLRDLVPTGIKTKGDDPDPDVVGFEMNFIESMGLIKYDFLGLRNLDVRDDAIADMKRHGAVKKSFDPTQIPLDDVATFEMLSRGLTEGVFQLESSGMKGWLRKLKPDCVEDVMAMVALYRPGPMEQIPHYVRRKHGEEEVIYPDKSLEFVLQDTYGIPLYQEQLMQIGQVIAGWSLGRADQLRKVIGKKIIDDIAKEKSQFVKDARNNGYESDWAEELFTTFIEPAARYGFNRAHSTAYGLLAYQTAYLKCNYPTFYFASLLKSIEDHPKRDEKMSAYIADAREMGVAILPPDINISDFSFTAIPSERSVRFGLNGIKNVGSKAVAEIISERKKGKFTDLFSTVERIKSTLVNSRCIESLVLSGAMDSLPGNRSSKFASLEKAFSRADCIKEDAKRVAAGGKPVKRKKPIPDAVVISAPENKLESLSKERELIGYYLSSHPFQDVAANIVASHTIQSAREEIDGSKISVGGIVSRLTEHTTKKGKQKMAFGAIEDDKAVLEFVIFPRQFEKAQITLDKPVVLHGKIETDVSEESEGGSQAKLIVDQVEAVGVGIKKGYKEEVITLLPSTYHKQLAALKADLEDRGHITDVKLLLPDGSTVKVIA